MALSHSPRIITDGLVLCLDAGNTKGYDKFENIQLYSNSLDVAASPSGYGGGYGQGWMQNPGDITKLNDGYGTYFTTTYSLVWSAYGQCNTSASTVYTVSFYAKSNTVANIRPRLYGNTTGTISTGTYQSLQTGGVADLGSWRKFTFVMPSTSNFGNSLIIELSTGTGFDIKNIQVERGTTATDYYETTSSTKIRGTTWTDLSGRGNNGTLVNGVGYSGSNGGSLSFDGTNDYSRISSFGDDSNLALSVFCWVYPKNLTSEQFGGNYLNWIINKRNTTEPNSNSWQFSTFNSYPTVAMWDNNNTTINSIGASIESNSTSAFQLNKWYYSGFTTDGTNGGSLKIYINDSVNYSGTLTGNRGIATKPIDIGKKGWGDEYYWNGNIAQVSIYNKALTASEIQQNFNALRGRFGI